MSKFVFNDKNYSGEPNPINDSIISTNTTWSSDKINNKMNKSNPTGTGSLSLNRKAGTTIGTNSVAVGTNTTASASNAYAEGSGTTASAAGAHAEGYDSVASGPNGSHAEGYGSHAEGLASHAENNGTATGDYSHAEGSTTTASKINSHAEGSHTQASGAAAHAEGSSTIASGVSSHAEGSTTTASNYQAHAEGMGTTASGSSSHAEGSGTTALGADSHAEGSGTIAKGPSQHAGGRYNIADNNNAYAEIIGNGASDNARSNARTLDWSGNESLAGTIDASGFGTRLGALIPDPGVELTERLEAGQTSLVFTSNVLSSDSKIDWYVPEEYYGIIAPKTFVTNETNHTLTLTFDAQQVDVDIRVVIK